MAVNKIYLSWRKGRGHSRHIIGELHRYGRQGYNFKYLQEGIIEAKKEGFINYPDFPNTAPNLEYTDNIKEVFSLRLIPEGRTDREKYLSFWEAKNDNYDWFDQLALTQGILTTDNFEFLGSYNPPKINSFVTDIANLTSRNYVKGTLQLHDRLLYKIEDSKHDLSGKHVKVFLGAMEIGYIKKIHNSFFIDAEKKDFTPTIHVKAIDQNGFIKQVYVVVKILP